MGFCYGYLNFYYSSSVYIKLIKFIYHKLGYTHLFKLHSVLYMLNNTLSCGQQQQQHAAVLCWVGVDQKPKTH